MFAEALALLLVAAAPQKPPALLVAPASALLSATPAPGYRPDEREVDNWRSESALNLRLSPLAALQRAAAINDRDPARCVKLNNYWCIKRAGWNGEIASDADGHVAFASAEEGAAVAALLLRRYYVDYNRRTARAIVERWAPAQCTLYTPLVRYGRPGSVASRAGMARMLPQRVVGMGLAPRGLQNTLRARWLAAHGRGGVATPSAEDVEREKKNDEIRMRNAKLIDAARRRVAEYRAESVRAARARPNLGMLPAPSIMEGGGEGRRGGKSAEITVGDTGAAVAAATPVAPTWTGVSCAGELVRIANYAASMAQGVAGSPTADLRLFDAAGRPTENLAKAMLNMAAVEIGPDAPREHLVTAAVAQLKRMLEDPGAAMLAAPKEMPKPGAEAGSAAR